MSTMDPEIRDDDGEYEDRSGDDIDIWGDGSPTNSTPLPDWWERGLATEDTENTEQEGT